MRFKQMDQKGEKKMIRLLGGRWILLFVVSAFLIVSACASGKNDSGKGGDTELFVHKSPDFTVTVPKSWSKSDKSKNPSSLLRKAYDPYEVTTFEIALEDQGDETKKDITKNLMSYFGRNYDATEMEVLYERDITLKDGTPAYETELKWKHPAIYLYTYRLTVYKNKKSISVSVTTDAKVSDALKAIPRSLTMK